MKKVIAISVVFALVAVGVFAADIGVDVFGTIVPASGSSNEDDPYVSGGGTWGRVQLGGSAENDDGTFGGWGRFRAGSWSGTPEAWGNAWWKPIDQFKLLFGGNNDGLFGADGVTRWGFYQVGGDVALDPNAAWYAGGAYYNGDDYYGGGTQLNLTFSDAFYGGWDGAGLVLTITPMSALEINVAIPFIDVDPNGNGLGAALPGSTRNSAKGAIKLSHLQAAFNIDNVGKVALTYKGGLGKDAEEGWDQSPGELLLYFGLSSIENLGLDVGFGFKLPEIQEDFMGSGKDFVTLPNLSAGLGASFNSGALGVKARLVAGFGGGATFDGDTDPDAFALVFDVLPSFAVNDKLTVLLSAGLGILGEDKDANGDTTADSRVAWHIHPYITIKSSWWAPNFYAGFRIESAGVTQKDVDAIVKWSIPVGIAFSF